MQRIRIAHRPVEAQGSRPYRLELGPRQRISAREESELMAGLDEGLRQPRNDTLCPAVKLRRHRFGKRRDLCNAHSGTPLIWGAPRAGGENEMRHRANEDR